MTTNVAIVTLGITQQDKDDVIGKLASVTDLPMRCSVFDLLSMKDAIGIQLAVNKVRADLILFYFHLLWWEIRDVDIQNGVRWDEAGRQVLDETLGVFLKPVIPLEKELLGIHRIRLRQGSQAS